MALTRGRFVAALLSIACAGCPSKSDTTAGSAVADPRDPCEATALERSNLFFAPHGMTLVPGAVGLLRQKTPEDPMSALKMDRALGETGSSGFEVRPRSMGRMGEVLRTLATRGRHEQSALFARDWGVLIDPECERIHGLTYRKVAEPGRRTKLRVGLASCAMCHSGRVAGRWFEGLGNKRIDVFTMMSDASALQPWIRFQRPFPGPMERSIRQASLEFSRRLSDVRVSNRTVGLVADAHVLWWVWNVTGGGEPELVPRAEMKVPPLWNMATRRGACRDIDLDGIDDVCDGGLFADGFGAGSGWFGGAVLGAGQDKNVVASRGYQEAVARAEQAVRALPPPPPYPCRIDETLRAEGEKLFEEKRCGRCHETAPGKPPHTVELKKIGTDALRAAGLGDGDYAQESRRRIDLIALEIPRLARAKYADFDAGATAAYGYVAPRLEGIWARFPYFHNGSVPTLYDLLSPPNERPRQFDLTLVDTRECFDPVRVGLLDSDACRPNLAKWKAPNDPEFFETLPSLRNVYDTRRSGHSSRGHAFFVGDDGRWTLDPRQRTALVEFLKTIGGTKLDADWCPRGAG